LSESWRTRPSARSGHCRMPVSVFMDSSFQSVAPGARVRWAFRGPAFRVSNPRTEWNRAVVPAVRGGAGVFGSVPHP